MSLLTTGIIQSGIFNAGQAYIPGPPLAYFVGAGIVGYVDSGNTFISVSNTFIADHEWIDVDFSKTNGHGSMVARDGFNAYTYDKGLTWYSGETVDMNDCRCILKDVQGNVWIGGNKNLGAGKLYKASEPTPHSNWTLKFTSSDGGPIEDVDYNRTGSFTEMLAITDGAFATSSDIGETWGDWGDQGYAYMDACYFYAKNTIAYASEQPATNNTLTYGNFNMSAWTNVNTTAGICHDVWMSPDGQLTYTVHDNGYFAAFITATQALAFSTVQLSSQSMEKVRFKDSSNGYSCGYNGKVFKTTNSGSSWTTIVTNTTANFNSCSIIYT